MPSLLDLVNQLICDYRSGPVLRDHIDLLKNKATEFERKFDLLGAEVLILRKEAAKQQADNARLAAENEDLKKRLQVSEKPSHDNLPDEQMEVLRLIALVDGSTDEKIFKAIDRNREAIQYDLEELATVGLIEKQYLCEGIFSIGLTQPGRRYLKRLGII